MSSATPATTTAPEKKKMSFGLKFVIVMAALVSVILTFTGLAIVAASVLGTGIMTAKGPAIQADLSAAVAPVLTIVVTIALIWGGLGWVVKKFSGGHH